jgi:hypothetical protein
MGISKWSLLLVALKIISGLCLCCHWTAHVEWLADWMQSNGWSGTVPDLVLMAGTLSEDQEEPGKYLIAVGLAGD